MENLATYLESPVHNCYPFLQHTHLFLENNPAQMSETLFLPTWQSSPVHFSCISLLKLPMHQSHEGPTDVLNLNKEFRNNSTTRLPIAINMTSV